MNRENLNRLRSLRIERLEMRHLLNADGFMFHQDHHDQHERPRREQRSQSVVTEVGFGRRSDVSTLQQDSLRQDSKGNRHIRHRQPRQDRAGETENRRSLVAEPMPTAALDLILTIDLQPEPEPTSVTPVNNFTSPPTTVPPVGRNVLFVVTFPTELSSTQPSAPSQGSVSAPLRSEAVVEPPAENRLPESSSPSDRVASESVDGSLQPAQNDPVRAVQLVSVVPQEIDPSPIVADHASETTLDGNHRLLSSASLAIENRRFDTSSLSQWLDQRVEIETQINELDDLLSTIAQERSDAERRVRPTHVAPRPTVVPETWDGLGGSAEPDFDDMVLLLPANGTANQPVGDAQQIFQAIDDAAVAQWTVGIGVHRVLDSADAIQFSRDVAAAEIGIVNSALRREETSTTATPSTEALTKTQRAAGILFCGLGMQYLKERRRTRNRAFPSETESVR